MKKRVIKVIILISLGILVIYIFMFLDTNRLMKQVKAGFLWKLDPTETAGEPINAYNYSRYAESDSFASIHLTLARLLVLHNYKNGYIWAYYSYEIRDTSDQIITGSQNIVTKWKIKKQDGQWKITEIFEKA